MKELFTKLDCKIEDIENHLKAFKEKMKAFPENKKDFYGKTFNSNYKKFEEEIC